MIQGAIFDMDGTLLDSMEMWDTVGAKYLISQGIEPELRLNEKFKKLSLDQAAQYFIDRYGVDKTVEQIRDEVNAMVENQYLYEVELKPGINELLQELKNKNVKMCVASATHKYLVSAVLKRCGVLDYFEDLMTCPEFDTGKDEPLIYRESLKALGTAKDKTCVFEDVLFAINTAKGDGFNVVGVYDKYENNQAQIRNTADAYIENFYELNNFWKYALDL